MHQILSSQRNCSRNISHEFRIAFHRTWETTRSWQMSKQTPETIEFHGDEFSPDHVCTLRLIRVRVCIAPRPRPNFPAGNPLGDFSPSRWLGGGGVEQLPQKPGSLANRSTSALPRGVGCQHDISPTNQPPRAGSLLLRAKDDTRVAGWRARGRGVAK